MNYENPLRADINKVIHPFSLQIILVRSTSIYNNMSIQNDDNHSNEKVAKDRIHKKDKKTISIEVGPTCKLKLYYLLKIS